MDCFYHPAAATDPAGESPAMISERMEEMQNTARKMELPLLRKRGSFGNHDIQIPMSYKLIDKQIIYTGKRVRLEIHHLEDEEGRRVQKEVCAHPGAVVILPFLNDDTILLIRNRRYTVGEILVELPAGGLEKNEIPMNAAGRELVEETGYLAGRLQRLFDFYSSPGILSEKMYTFAAYDLEPVERALEEAEEIEVMPVPFDDAVRMIKDGLIQDGKTIATLLAYDRFYRNAALEPRDPRETEVA